MTDVKQAQGLLLQMGYPIGAADGVLGNLTRGATLSFQRSWNFGNPLLQDGDPGKVTVGALQHSVGLGRKLSPNFAYVEFACGHGACGYCHGWCEVPHAVLQSCELSRAQLFERHGMGMEIVGGSRCEQRNRIVIKGAADSQHLHKNLGNAADPQPYFTWEQFRDIHAGITGMEVRAGSGDACFHIDDRPGDPNHPQVFGWVPRLAGARGTPDMHGARADHETIPGWSQEVMPRRERNC